MTEREVELSEDEKAELNQQMAILLDKLDECPVVTLTYFVPDARKEGGSHQSLTGIVRKYDDYNRILTFDNGIKVGMQNIIDIQFKNDKFNLQ